MAIVIVVLIINARTQVIDGLLSSLFGPPNVTLKEAYSERVDGPTFDHSLFNTILQEMVDAEGWVDYQQISADTADLEGYIIALAGAPFDEMGRSEKLALLINAYNAFTLKLIVEGYPIDSIKDIPSTKRWDDVRWNIGGNIWSLNQIEHEQIRPKFKEPRIHFALVCAAVGCPPLRNEAFTAAHLSEQLEQQTRYVHQHRTWFEFDLPTGNLNLTPLYKWYGDDFAQVKGSEIKFASEYSSNLAHYLADGSKPAVGWLNYDWRLNDKKNKSVR